MRDTDQREKDIIWAAGFLDGEGYIGINRRWPTLKNRSTTPTYWLTVRVTNTNKHVLTAVLQRLFEGHVVEKDKKRTTKRCYEWRSVSNVSENALTILLPYLKVKHKEAKLALEFQALMRATSPSIRWVGVTPENVAQREAYYWVLREAKKW